MAYTADSKSAAREGVRVRAPLPVLFHDGGAMDCRPGCGACCEAPSISSPLPGYPDGKPPFTPCPCLLPDYRCALFGLPTRPAVCSSLRPEPLMCGSSREEALAYLRMLERETAP